MGPQAMMPFWRCFLCLAISCVCVAGAYAQTPVGAPPQNQQQPAPRPGAGFADFDELDLEDLLNITVSIATGRVERAEEAPSIVSVVTAEEIRRMGARTLADVLQTVPGFEVTIDNQGRSAIVVRGVRTPRSENVLVLFNGHRLNDHINGGATVNNFEIPLYNIKQVEIIRGPGSALFGTNAFVGVINLVPFTSKSFDGLEVSAQGGSFGTRQYDVAAAHTAGALGVSASFQFSDASGPKLLVPADGQTETDSLTARFGFPPISLAPRTTFADHRGVDLILNGSYRGFTANARVHDDRSGGFIGPIDVFGGRNQLDSRQILFDAGQTLRLAERTSLSARFGFTQNHTRDFLRGAPPGYIVGLPTGGVSVFRDGVLFDFTNNSRRYATDLVVDQRLSDKNQLSIGAGYEVESTFGLRSAGNFDVFTGAALPDVRPLPFTVVPVKTRTIASVFAQDTWTLLPQLSATAGIRYDHYNDFGDTVNPRAGLVWRLPQRFYVKTLYGRAFRAPTLVELFIYLPRAAIGNAELKPSTINTSELSVGYNDRRTRMAATYFANVSRDFLTGPTELADGRTTFLNTAGLTVQGMELELKHTVGFDHAVFANYVYQHPRDRESGRVPYVPSHLATLGITAGIGRYVSVTPTVLLRGERPREDRDDREPVPGYGVVHLNVRLKELFNGVELAGTVNNLFDKAYADPSPRHGVPADYPRPGRSGLLKLSYKF